MKKFLAKQDSDHTPGLCNARGVVFVDNFGTVTPRYGGRMHYIGLGRRDTGQRVTLLVAGRDMRVVNAVGRLMRPLTLDPTRDYQTEE